MAHTDHVDPSKDFPDPRVIDLGNNKLYIGRDMDQNGFYKIWFDKGQIPESLKGKYTSYLLAEKAVRHYLDAKRREIVVAKLEK